MAKTFPSPSAGGAGVKRSRKSAATRTTLYPRRPEAAGASQHGPTAGKTRRSADPETPPRGAGREAGCRGSSERPGTRCREPGRGAAFVEGRRVGSVSRVERSEMPRRRHFPDLSAGPEAVAFDLLPTAGHSLMERPPRSGRPEPSSATPHNRSKRRRERASLKNTTPKAHTGRPTPTPAGAKGGSPSWPRERGGEGRGDRAHSQRRERRRGRAAWRAMRSEPTARPMVTRPPTELERGWIAELPGGRPFRRQGAACESPLHDQDLRFVG